MSKDYGPKAFVKAWQKALSNFNETKIFFCHDKSKTTIKYIHGDKLYGVEMYRCQFEIDRWIGHFQYYLDTGTFDPKAYWVVYTSEMDEEDKLKSTYGPTVTGVLMSLEKQLWNVHSPELNRFMRETRNVNRDVGFEQVNRPYNKI